MRAWCHTGLEIKITIASVVPAGLYFYFLQKRKKRKEKKKEKKRKYLLNALKGNGKNS